MWDYLFDPNTNIYYIFYKSLLSNFVLLVVLKICLFPGLTKMFLLQLQIFKQITVSFQIIKYHQTTHSRFTCWYSREISWIYVTSRDTSDM